jgi:teichuronopeptide biosynthesis TupA-like protein
MFGLMRSIADAAVLWAVRIWCYVRHPLLIARIYREFRRWPDPALPCTICDKLLWRRLFDHNPDWVQASDKLVAKEFVRKLAPHVCTARVLWRGTDPAKIPNQALAGAVVVKTNNASGRNLFLGKGPVDRPAFEAQCRQWLKRPYGRATGEWAYAGIEPKLFVEEMIAAEKGPVDHVYDLYVCNGRMVYCVALVGPKKQTVERHVFDRAGASYAVQLRKNRRSVLAPRPANWDEIVNAGETLGAGFDMVRCDLFVANGEIWFAEFTIYSLAGLCWIGCPELMDALNRSWDLRRTWFMQNNHSGGRAVYAKVLARALLSCQPAPPEHNVPVPVMKAIANERPSPPAGPPA